MLKSLLLRRMLAAGFFLLILAGSSIPGENIPRVFELTPDKLIHCVEYAVLGFFVALWASSEFSKFQWIHRIVLIISLGAIAGMTDELYQFLTPGRSPDVWDWCLDVVGIFIGTFSSLWIQKKWSAFF